MHAWLDRAYLADSFSLCLSDGNDGIQRNGHQRRKCNSETHLNGPVWVLVRPLVVAGSFVVPDTGHPNNLGEEKKTIFRSQLSFGSTKLSLE